MPSPSQVLREVRRFIEAARPGDTDPILLERFALTRDNRAFAELVRRHGPMVLGVCRRVLRHTADAEDAFQATFLILVRKAVTVRDPDRLGPWLYGVAWRTANKLRTTRRSGLPLTDDIPAHSAADNWPVELDAAIARLPEKYRTPVVLCHLQGLSPGEVAGRLGCAATVVTRLFRARAALRRRLSSLGLAVPPALLAGSVLDLPSSLASTVSHLAAGRSTSPAAACLADGVFRSMVMTKVRWAATAAMLVVGGVSVVGLRAGGQDPASATSPQRVTPEPRPTAPVGPPASPDLPPPVATPSQPGVPPALMYDQATQAAYTTANFQVTAPSIRIGRLIGEAAECARKDVALAWLGKELADWPQPWTIRVSLGKAVSGATTFNFDNQPLRGNMQVEGELDRLLADVVPHEVTHCVIADHFRAPVPRWADEGISLMSESDEERTRYALAFRDTLNTTRRLQIKALFNAREYPGKDVMAFFWESYCVTQFLVMKKDRPTFVQFVADGMKDGWEPAAKTHYGFATLNDLEREFLNSSKPPVSTSPTTTAIGPPNGPLIMLATAGPDGRIAIRSSVISYQPVTNYQTRTNTVVRDGKSVEQTYFEPVTSFQFVRNEAIHCWIAAMDINAFTADGKKLDGSKVLETVRAKPTPVVVASDWEVSQKTYAEILKPGTIVIVLPAPKPVPVMPVPAGGR